MNFQDISDFVLGSPIVPQSAKDMTATLLIDTLGVAAGGAEMDAGVIARNHALRFMAGGSDQDSATLLFDGRKASLTGAGFALATQIDNLDAHDGYNPVKGHIGCAVVPALFAFAEHLPDLTGAEAIDALAMSYEIAGRAGLSLHGSVSDYHTSGAWNALGVAALGARLFNLSQDQLRQALGIAEYHGPRSQMMREIATPTMLHDGSGMGAMVGTMAVLLAQDGFTGAPAITVEDDAVAHHWADLGSVWTVEQNYIKPYPICRWAHAAIDALSRLMQTHDFSADQVTQINVRTFREAAALFPRMPETTSQAQYSLPFALAAMLVHGKITSDEITGIALGDDRLAAILPKIEVAIGQEHQDRFPAGRWSDVTVHLSDGQVLASGDQPARGGPDAPLELHEIESKFRNIASILAPERRSAIWAMRDALAEGDVPLKHLTRLITASVQDGS